MNYARWRDAAHTVHVMGAIRPFVLLFVFPPASNALQSMLRCQIVHEAEAGPDSQQSYVLYIVKYVHEHEVCKRPPCRAEHNLASPS